MSLEKFDIVIVGGGMVGLSMAASLIESELSIALIEKSPVDLNLSSQLLMPVAPSPFDFDIRVSAISPRNKSFLSGLGVWQNIPKLRCAEYQTMTVWDGEGSSEITFEAAELAQRHLGSIVENRVIQAAIATRIINCRNIRIIDQTEIESIEQDDSRVKVRLSNHHEIQAKLLIGADGAHSKVRNLLKIETEQMPYQQTAFVANVETELPHHDTAWQRFTRFGPVAFLPLPLPNVCSIVWTADKAQADGIEELDNETFEQSLAKAFESRLGKVKLASEFGGFPLVKRHAQRYIEGRCVLVGDAAHTIHPLAGQGVNLGFQDVENLSQLILSLKNKQRDFANPLNLKPFERERKVLNRVTQEAMSGFKWMFGNNNLPLTMLRNIGIRQINQNKTIKNYIAKQAMGI